MIVSRRAGSATGRTNPATPRTPEGMLRYWPAGMSCRHQSRATSSARNRPLVGQVQQRRQRALTLPPALGQGETAGVAEQSGDHDDAADDDRFLHDLLLWRQIVSVAKRFSALANDSAKIMGRKAEYGEAGGLEGATGRA
jgi:hypothetical protein